MHSRSSLRNELGAGYFTQINDREFIRWKPLSIEDFFHYEALAKDPNIVSSILEDEIFDKCVTDPNYLRIKENLPFGIVTSVAQNIMEHSGPLSIQHFNDFLDSKRALAQEPIHHLVPLIVRAFPSYQLEDIYAMPFDTFMMRLAQAESLLLMLKIIDEPLRLIDENEEKKPKQRNPKHIPAELKAAWEKQQLKKPPQPPKETKSTGVKFDKVDMTPEKSPIFNKNTKHPQYKPLGDLNQERVVTEQNVGSEEESGERAKMVKDAQKLYSPLIKKMDFYKNKK